uniref:Uncharacterized protein n=1 Tax=Glossina morsitans morsitans TaxID=37546 RepID=A0A1B0FBG8_GLOMM
MLEPEFNEEFLEFVSKVHQVMKLLEDISVANKKEGEEVKNLASISSSNQSETETEDLETYQKDLKSLISNMEKKNTASVSSFTSRKPADEKKANVSLMIHKDHLLSLNPKLNFRKQSETTMISVGHQMEILY